MMINIIIKILLKLLQNFLKKKRKETYKLRWKELYISMPQYENSIKHKRGKLLIMKYLNTVLRCKSHI